MERVVVLIVLLAGLLNWGCEMENNKGNTSNKAKGFKSNPAGLFRLFYPKGQVHLIELSEDNKARQEFYNSKNGLNGRRPLFVARGEWSFHETKGRINVEGLLCYHPERHLDSLYSTPKRADYIGFYLFIYENCDESLLWTEEFNFLRIRDYIEGDTSKTLPEKYDLTMGK